MLDGSHYFECACGSPEHTIRFILDKGERGDFPLIFCDFYLDQYLPWYKRIWVAIKYVLMFKPHNEHFASWVMKNEDVERLQKLCKEFKNE